MTGPEVAATGAQEPLVIDGVRVAYPDGPDERVVLDGLDLRVRRSELVVISGRSGASSAC